MFVQSNSFADTITSASKSVSFLNDNIAGNTLVCWVRYNRDSTTTSTLTDTKLNVWHLIQRLNSGVGGDINELWYAENCAAGPNTVTSTPDAASEFWALIVAEYNECVFVGSFDNSAGQILSAPPTGTDTITSGNFSTGGNKYLIVGGMNYLDGSTTINAGTGFTERARSSPDNLDAYSLLEDMVLAGKGTTAATFSFTQTGSNNVGCIGASFKFRDMFSGTKTGRAFEPVQFNNPLGWRGRRAFGIASTVNNFQQSLSATLSFVGSINRTISAGLIATLNFVGVLFKRTATTLSTATLSFIGAFANVKLVHVLLTATLSFVGAMQRSTSRRMTATLSFTGNLVKQTSTNLSAGLSFVGAIVRRTIPSAFSATLNFSGTLLKSTNAHLTASLSFVGALVKAARTHVSAGLSFGGSLLIRTASHLAATLSFVGNLSAGSFFTAAFTATLSFVVGIGGFITTYIPFTGSAVEWVVRMRRRFRRG